jgi:hypothetical protein
MHCNCHAYLILLPCLGFGERAPKFGHEKVIVVIAEICAQVICPLLEKKRLCINYFLFLQSRMYKIDQRAQGTTGNGSEPFFG